MRVHLPPVYPISPPDLTGDALLAWARELIGAGATLLQYRRKGGADCERLEELRALVALARPLGCAVIANDRLDLCLLAEAGGLHLGQEDLPASEARALLGPGALLGLSTHDAGQAEQAWGLPVDYIALGPVFPTGSKERPDPVVPPEVQRAVAARSPVPVVAIGGLTPERAGLMYERGFASVAVISALGREPGAAFRRFLERAP